MYNASKFDTVLIVIKVTMIKVTMIKVTMIKVTMIKVTKMKVRKFFGQGWRKAGITGNSTLRI